MKESNVRIYIYNEVKKRKGLCIKLSSAIMRGLPDRLVLLPGAKIGFCELKGTGLVPRAAQTRVHKILIRLGFKIWVCDDMETTDNFLNSL